MDNFESGLDFRRSGICGRTGPQSGSAQVPRGPRLAKDSMEQLLLSAFVGRRKRLQIDMPWEQGSAKRVFSKDSLVPRPLQGLHSRWVELPTTGSDAQASDDPAVLTGNFTKVQWF